MSAYVVVTSNEDAALVERIGGTRYTIESLADLEPAAGLIILAEDADDDTLVTLCRRIRPRPEPRIYLAPIVNVGRSGMRQTLENARDMVDLVLDPNLSWSQVEAEIHRYVASIHHYIEGLPDVGSSRDTNIAFKVLRYMQSRGQEMLPTPTSRTIQGYTYPPIEPFFGRHDDSLFQVLDFLESEHLLRGEFVDHVHLCNFCGSAFLNFVETCPQCGGKDLQRDELLHHFPCGYMGSSQEFKKGGDKVCPKCDQRLRGLGTDYDKPSLVYTCRECCHVFQDPEIATLCYHCRRPSRPEDLVERDIKRYTLTALGEQCALYGLDSLFRRFLDEGLNLLDVETFKIFLGVEAARIKRYKISTSSLALLEIPGLQHLYVKFGRRSREVFGELAAIIKAVLRTTDIITTLTDSAFLILMVETPAEGAAVAMRRLQEQTEKLLAAEQDVAATIRTNIVPIDGEEPVDTLIERLLA